MKPTGIVNDAIYLSHATPDGHPEHRRRLEAIAARLSGETRLMDRLRRLPAASADLEALAAVHAEAYLDVLAATAHADGTALTADTFASRRSFQAARQAAGGVMAAVDAVMAGTVENAFALDKIKIMEASVAKWNRIIAGESADGGVLDCPPCRIYYMLICYGCPIAEYTGKKFCRGSPYPKWYWHQVNEHGEMRRKVYCPKCLEYATEMRDFMIEILDHLKAERLARETAATEAPDDASAT